MLRSPCALSLTLIGAMALMHSSRAEVRTWTDVTGREVEGELVRVTGDSVVLKVGTREFTLPASKFSEEDQAFITKWESREPAPEDAASESGEWPSEVKIPDDIEVEVLSENDDENEFVYRTPNFEFKSDVELSTSLIRELCRVFEATLLTVKTLPAGLDPQVPKGVESYQGLLFGEADSYFQAGGMVGSGGMYSGGKKVIMIPLENMGVRRVGNRFVVEAQDENQTLKHEITHQVMHRWLGRTAMWFTEGWAEYIAAAPHTKGRYKFTGIDRAVREDVLDSAISDGREFNMIPIERLMTISNAEWAAELAESPETAHRNYKSAMLLVYYFLHMDEGENGGNTKAFLAAITGGLGYEAAAEKFFLRGRSYDEIGESLAKAWRSEGIRVVFEGEE